MAFSEATDAVQLDSGFELKFRKDKDSIGYYTGAFGGEDYSVENIHLDVTPIELNRSLYRALSNQQS